MIISSNAANLLKKKQNSEIMNNNELLVFKLLKGFSSWIEGKATGNFTSLLLGNYHSNV